MPPTKKSKTIFSNKKRCTITNCKKIGHHGARKDAMPFIFIYLLKKNGMASDVPLYFYLNRDAIPLFIYITITYLDAVRVLLPPSEADAALLRRIVSNSAI